MKIPFDKIYVISYIKNIEKQNNIKHYLNNVWNVDFEFIYGIDTNNLVNIFNLNNIHFIGNNENIKYDIGHISCGIGHYTAIQHAYEHNLNSCLIIEDDTIFTNNLNYIEYCFNNMPEDADCCRFALTSDKYPLLEQANDFWVKNTFYIGCQCYSINNRETMQQYINEMNKYFREADDMTLLHDRTVYVLKTLMGKDPASSMNIKE